MKRRNQLLTKAYVYLHLAQISVQLGQEYLLLSEINDSWLYIFRSKQSVRRANRYTKSYERVMAKYMAEINEEPSSE